MMTLEDSRRKNARDHINWETERTRTTQRKKRTVHQDCAGVWASIENGRLSSLRGVQNQTML